MLVAVEIEAVKEEHDLGIGLEQQLGGKLVESCVGLELEQLGLEGKLAQLCLEKMLEQQFEGDWVELSQLDLDRKLKQLGKVKVEWGGEQLGVQKMLEQQLGDFLEQLRRVGYYLGLKMILSKLLNLLACS